MAEIDRLTVVFDANFKALDDKLNKVIRSNYGAASKIEKRWDSANDNIAKKFGKGLGATFNSEIGGLAAGAGRASTALSGFGAAGLTAAAGIAALGAAFSGAREAARFADDIADTADRLHVTTDALQEYRYAIRAAGGEEKGADEALENFSVTLGKAQQGLAKSQKAFIALGFSKEQIKGFTDADTALKAVVERIAGLSDAQQDAIIQQLGLEKIKPLIDDGVASMQALRDEARKVGVVMDADLIKRGAELNDQFDTVAKVIDVQLKSALIDLAPVLLGLIKLVADLARAASSVADAFRSVQNKSSEGLRDRRSQLSEEATRLGVKSIAGQRLSKPEQQRLDRVNAQIAGIDTQLASRAASNVATPVTPTRSLIDASKSSGGGKKAKEVRDSTDQRTAQVEAALDDAERDLLQAWSSLTVGAQEQADIQKLILDVEQKTLNDRIDKQIADIKADEGLTSATKASLEKNLEIVRLEQGKVDALRREQIDRETAEQMAQQALDKQQLTLDGATEILQLQSSMARTAAARREIELKLLDAADQRLTAELDAVLASKTASEADKELARIKLGQLEASRGARRKQVEDNTKGPLQSYFDSLPRGVDEVNEAFQNLEAQGINSLIDGLAAASVGAADLGDVFRQTIQQMAMDANRILLQSLLSGATGGASGGGGFLKSLFKIGASAVGGGLGGDLKFAASLRPDLFAEGTDSAPGGMAWVGERGPELLNIPRGAQVIPNDILRGLSRGGGAGGQSTTNHWNVNVAPNGRMTAADARRTGRQIAASASMEMARTRRAGING